MTMIYTRGLAHEYRTRRSVVQAVRDVNLAVEEGELIAFLGPNGAGKTTTMRMLTTSLRPTAGHAVIAGHDLLRDPSKVRRQIGYVPQGASTSPENTVMEELVMQARLYGFSKAEAIQRADVLVDRLDLRGLEKRLARNLSGGQQRRVDVALAVIHTPKVLFLDEPTTGLDPQSRANLWEHLRRLREDFKTTVFLSTHYLDEADTLAERIFIIDKGVIVAQGTSGALKSSVNHDESITISVGDEDLVATEKEAWRSPGVVDVNIEGGAVDIRVRREQNALSGILRSLGERQIPVHSVQLRQTTLDDVFMAYTGRSLRDSPTLP